VMQVGIDRVTGLLDCHWSNSRLDTWSGSAPALGDRVAYVIIKGIKGTRRGTTAYCFKSNLLITCLP
jgi:hypothetical protein